MYKLVVLAAVASAINISGESEYRCDAAAHPWCKKQAGSTWNKPDWPIGYKVPNFGVDKDIISTQGHIKAAEKRLKQKFTATFKKAKSHPVDYPVVNLGIDKDILDAQASIAGTETILGKWTPTQDKNGYWSVPEAAASDSYSYKGGKVTVKK